MSSLFYPLCQFLKTGNFHKGKKKNRGKSLFHPPTKNITNMKLIEKKPLNKKLSEGFPGGAVVESLSANAGDTGSSPGLGRSHMPRSN